ncbi:MAG: LysR family transcriptional regulator [Gammaproteobacteria bacterium]|nr:LysR family transcriptional regulator [Gammaproteobacteria bacterium]
MNIETVRAFLEVAASGSFQQAAENLHITQSAMSARIKGLESHLNRQLFNRKRNGATLTSGGQAFYKHALTVVRTWELARQEIALSNEFSAIVGLGVQLNHWKSTATPWLQWMKENAPDLATQVHSDYSDRLMGMLRNGLINVAVVYEPQRNPDMLIEQYAEEQLVLVSTVPRAVAKHAVEGYVFIDWGHGFRVAHSQAFPESPTHQMTVGLAAVGLGHILERGGSGYFLEREVDRLLREGRLHRVTGAPQFTLKAYLAYFAEARDTPAVQTALRGLEQVHGDFQKCK